MAGAFEVEHVLDVFIKPSRWRTFCLPKIVEQPLRGEVNVDFSFHFVCVQVLLLQTYCLCVRDVLSHGCDCMSRLERHQVSRADHVVTMIIGFVMMDQLKLHFGM